MTSSTDTMRQLMADLRAEKDALYEQTAPLRAEYDRLVNEAAEMNRQALEIAEEIKAVELPRMVEIDQQLSGLARALGARVLSESQ